MNAKILAAALSIVLIAACSKDKYSTKPNLELKSVNGNVFPRNSNLSFQFNVTDKEGDIQDTMWVQKVSFVCPDEGSYQSSYALPDFTSTKNLKVELDLNYSYGSLSGGFPIISGCTSRNDSCYFKFWLKDKAGNVSDTVTSETLKLLKD